MCSAILAQCKITDLFELKAPLICPKGALIHHKIRIENQRLQTRITGVFSTLNVITLLSLSLAGPLLSC